MSLTNRVRRGALAASLSVALGVGFTACSGGSSGDFAPAGNATPAPQATAAAQATSAPPVAHQQRRIIRDAKVSLSVESVSQSFARVRASVDGWGGYIADSQLESSTGGGATLKIRVPASSLDKVLVELSKLGKVLSQSETGQDVSQEYTDLESQLRNLRVAEARLLQLMQKSGNVKDLLEVETQVTETRGKIEAIQGRLRAIDNQVSYSTIEVNLVEPQSAVKAEPPTWSLSETVDNAQTMSLFLLQLLTSAAIYLVFLAPFAAPMGLWAFWKSRRARRRPELKAEKREE